MRLNAIALSVDAYVLSQAKLGSWGGEHVIVANTRGPRGTLTRELRKPLLVVPNATARLLRLLAQAWSIVELVC